MEGEPVSKTDMWDFDGYRRQRHRFEHSHLTTGMWATTGACGRMCVRDTVLKLIRWTDGWMDGMGRCI